MKLIQQLVLSLYEQVIFQLLLNQPLSVVDLCFEHLLLLFNHVDFCQIFFLYVGLLSNYRFFNGHFVLISLSLIDCLIILSPSAYLIFNIVSQELESILSPFLLSYVLLGKL